MTAPTILSQEIDEAGYSGFLTIEGFRQHDSNEPSYLIAIAPADNVMPTEIVEQNAGAGDTCSRYPNARR